jgi:hypothetical protein
VFEKLDEPERASRAADEAVVERDAHDLRRFGPFLVQEIEAVDHVAGELDVRRRLHR